MCVYRKSMFLNLVLLVGHTSSHEILAKGPGFTSDSRHHKVAFWGSDMKY